MGFQIINIHDHPSAISAEFMSKQKRISETNSTRPKVCLVTQLEKILTLIHGASRVNSQAFLGDGVDLHWSKTRLIPTIENALHNIMSFISMLQSKALDKR